MQIRIMCPGQTQPVSGDMLGEKTNSIELDMSENEATTFKMFDPEW